MNLAATLEGTGLSGRNFREDRGFCSLNLRLRKVQDATAFMQSPRFLQNFRVEGEKMFRII